MARELGVDHKTLFRWANDVGLDHHALSLEASERNRTAAAAKNARVALDRAEARERVITRLLRTLAFATELRKVREQDPLELEAGGIEDGEYEEIDDGGDAEVA